MSRPPYSLCVCPDSGLLHGRINTLLAAHPEPGGGLAPAGEAGRKRFVFWGDEGLPPAFWEHLTLQGLFATPKALVLRNAQNLPAETLKELSRALERTARGTPSAVWPIICLEVPFERGQPKVAAHIQRLPCYALAEKHRWIDVTPGLAQGSMPAYIRAEASRHGLALEPAQVAALARALPEDAGRIGTELAKLALAADAEGKVGTGALRLVEQAFDVNIFELLRLLQQSGHAPAVWRRLLEDRLGGENSVFAFIAILLREGRALWQILAGAAPPMPPQAAAGKKILAQSLGFAGVAKIWELALMADKGIKTGERSPEQAFEMLAAELFILFRAV